ncbi:hypothetical protein SNEBB_000741 [Seison nebaliae]|nr:hypothetical protein SNEBB_000741 [Seison nebaliae]
MTENHDSVQPLLNLVNSNKSVKHSDDDADFIMKRIDNLSLCIQGDESSRKSIITLHDLGANGLNQMLPFFLHQDLAVITRHQFSIIHVTAPGQENKTRTISEFPTMDQLSSNIFKLIRTMNIQQYVVFGVGFGANVLARLAKYDNERCVGAVLFNISSSKCGWLEWYYQKWNIWYLLSHTYTDAIHQYILWHHFGSRTMNDNPELVEDYGSIINNEINPYNLGLLIQTYTQRTDLNIVREMKENNIKCPSLFIIGNFSDHEDDTEYSFSRVPSNEASFMKIQDCGGAPLLEQPEQVAEAFRLFLQGLGFLTKMSVTEHTIPHRRGTIPEISTDHQSSSKSGEKEISV